MRILLLAVFAAALAVCAHGQTQFLKPEGIAPGNGYSHVVTVGPGKLVFVSGQVANDAQGQLVGRGDLKAQAERVFDNLKLALKAAGTTFENVVKITWYVRDYKPEMLPVLRGVRDRYVSKEHPPASTLVGVAALFRDEYLLEVEAVAVVNERGK